MSSVSVAQLSLVPNASTILSGIVQVTGIKSAVPALEQAKVMANSKDYSPSAVSSFIANIKSVLSSVGEYMDGGGFSQLEAEIVKYEGIAAAIEAGQTSEIADVVYVSPNGQRYDLVLSLSAKVIPAAA